ncbi:acyltransferase family protein [Sphingomonas sp.]|uniref:acyltransferase family protein n=1 Tax=Sphingomonas sp. TaxID=28214 RepID=UPI003AFFFE1C
MARDPAAAGRLDSVQVLRGLAALVVALYHSALIMTQYALGDLGVLLPLTAWGWTGVLVFFVLSGFIICHAHAKDVGRPQRLGRYAWRRFSRVYPVYWLFLTAFIAASLAGLAPVKFSTAPTNLATAYTLVQFLAVPSLPLKVAWTLVYEVGFYALFAVLIVHRAAGLVAMAAWFALVIANAFVWHDYEVSLIGVWNLGFLAGFAAWWSSRRLPPAAGMPLLGLGVAAFLALALAGRIAPSPGEAQPHPGDVITLTLASALLLLGAVLAERRMRRRFPAALLLLGDASYALYLVHSAVISVLCILLSRHRGAVAALPPALLFVLIAGAAIASGIAAHRLAEKPLLRLLRGRRAADPSVPVPL